MKCEIPNCNRARIPESIQGKYCLEHNKRIQRLVNKGLEVSFIEENGEIVKVERHKLKKRKEYLVRI